MVYFMTYRSQTGSRKSSGQKFQKSAHEKAKSKAKKPKANGQQYAPEVEEHTVSPKELAEKTISKLNRLGSQTFALSPFSNYFDEWLSNLGLTVSEFESSPQISADDQFNRERAQILLDIERALAEKRIQETDQSGDVKALHENNHLLGDMDAEYATKNRDLSNKRNADVQRLTNQVRELEPQLEEEKERKIGFFQVSARRESVKKIHQLTADLAKAKSELEVTLQNFDVEQEKLHDDYEKRKQAVMLIIQELEKKLERLEVDTSVEPRKTACEALANSVNALVQRLPSAKEEVGN
jgi:hypothetical protein